MDTLLLSANSMWSPTVPVVVSEPVALTAPHATGLWAQHAWVGLVGVNKCFWRKEREGRREGRREKCKDK